MIDGLRNTSENGARAAPGMVIASGVASTSVKSISPSLKLTWKASFRQPAKCSSGTISMHHPWETGVKSIRKRRSLSRRSAFDGRFRRIDPGLLLRHQRGGLDVGGVAVRRHSGLGVVVDPASEKP